MVVIVEVEEQWIKIFSVLLKLQRVRGDVDVLVFWCVAAVQGSGVMFKNVEVTLHKEGNSFGFVIRGE